MTASRRTATRVLPALIVTALAAAACGGSNGDGGTGAAQKPTNAPIDTVKDGGTLTYGADQEASGYNNSTSKDNSTAAANVDELVLPSVFRIHPDFTIVLDKDLMESAELTSSAPETIVYKIKAAAKWSDGVPVDAEDFIQNWKALNGTDKKFDVAGTTGYDQIASVVGSDGGKTVTVVFKTPFAEWRSLFGNLIPAHVLTKAADIHEAWNNGFNKGFGDVSAGPYKFGPLKAGESLTMVRNDAYFGPKAHLDSIVFRILPESTTQPDALKNGEVGLIYPQPQLDLVSQVKAIPDVTSETNFGLSFEHIDFNTKTPGLNDKQVRLAIAQALDIDSMLKRTVAQFSDKASVLGNRIFLTGQPEYVDNSAGYGKGDTKASDATLTAAGYAKGADGIYAKAGKKLSFRFSTTAGNALREVQGELFKTQMKAAGIDIKIDNPKAAVLFGERLPQGNFDIADFAWVGSPFATATNSIYITSGGQNYGKGSDPIVDAMFPKALAELDDTKRKDILNGIDAELWKNMVTIPLYQKPTYIAYSNKYGNIHDNASQEGPFWNANTWGLK